MIQKQCREPWMQSLYGLSRCSYQIHPFNIKRAIARLTANLIIVIQYLDLTVTDNEIMRIMIQQILIHKGNAAQQNIHSLNGCTCHKIGNKIEICFHVLVMCIGECVDGVFRNKAGCSTSQYFLHRPEH